MLFIVAISFSLITISGSFTSSWSRIVEIIENENSDIVSAPQIRVGEPKYYKASQIKIVDQDNVIIAFPRKVNPTTSAENRFLPEAA